jgi:hypothetical protein
LNAEAQTKRNPVPGFSLARAQDLRLARDTRVLILRAGALAVWVACVVLVFVPTHGSAKSTPFQGGKPAQPRTAPAHPL